MHPEQLASTELAPKEKFSLNKALLNLAVSAAVGGIATAAAVIFGLGLLGAVAIGLVAGVGKYIFRGKKNLTKPVRSGAASLILATVVIALPWALLYAAARYVLSASFLPIATDILLAAFAFNWIQALLGGIRSAKLEASQTKSSS